MANKKIQLLAQVLLVTVVVQVLQVETAGMAPHTAMVAVAVELAAQQPQVQVEMVHQQAAAVVAAQLA